MAGFFAAFMSLPFDNMKVRMQQMKPDPKTGEYPYKNIVDAMMKTTVREGPFKLWVGFPMFYVRIAPHVMIHLFILDYFN